MRKVDAKGSVDGSPTSSFVIDALSEYYQKRSSIGSDVDVAEMQKRVRAGRSAAKAALRDDREITSIEDRAARDIRRALPGFSRP